MAAAPRIVLLGCLLLWVELSHRALLAQLPAFPGAEGFGAAATGGRGGEVVYVTTTAASGPGSLQAALDRTNAHTFPRGNVTIVGETSQGGITVRGFVTDETPFQDQAVRAPVQFADPPTPAGCAFYRVRVP